MDSLETLKEPYLFCSDDLIAIVEITPSIKTKIEMINIIGPRLVDPSAKVSTFTGMFRFTEDKNTVEEVLKTRMNAINAAQFTNKNAVGALRGGRGAGRGRGGGLGRGSGSGRMAPAVGGRAGRGGGVTSRPSSTKIPAPISPRVSPKSTLKKTFSMTADDSMKTPVLPDRQENPEICPEDTDCESMDLPPVVDRNRPLPEVPIAATSVYVRPQPIDISMAPQRVLFTDTSTSSFDSPHTDGENFTPYSCNTPIDPQFDIPPVPRRSTESPASGLFNSVTTDQAEVVAIQPSTASTATHTKSTITIETLPVVSEVSKETTETSAAERSECSKSSPTCSSTEAVAEPTAVTPAGMIVIAARAPQRGPPAASSRRGGSNPSPIPTSNNTPSITPSVSHGNLVSLTQNPVATTSSTETTTVKTESTSSASAEPAAVVHKGSYASQSGTYDLSPMVADCKPEVGVHALLSKFSGHSPQSTTTGSTARPLPPVDTPAKTRKISDLANAFTLKPASSTASSTISASSAGLVRNQAPAPIVIPGASSLAAMRAKFSNPSSTSSTTTGSSTSTTSRFQRTSPCKTDISAATTVGIILSEDTSTERKLIRRHSEGINIMNPGTSAYATALQSLNNLTTSNTLAAEVSGAGADLASRCAMVLQLSKAEFLALPQEEALFIPENETESEHEGETEKMKDNTRTKLLQFSYREVVRRNYHKEHSELNVNVLEQHVIDDEFLEVFKKTKVGVFVYIIYVFFVISVYCFI